MLALLAEHQSAVVNICDSRPSIAVQCITLYDETFSTEGVTTRHMTTKN